MDVNPAALSLLCARLLAAVQSGACDLKGFDSPSLASDAVARGEGDVFSGSPLALGLPSLQGTGVVTVYRFHDRKLGDEARWFTDGFLHGGPRA